MSLEQIELDIESWSADWQASDAEPEVSLDSIRRSSRRYAWSALGSWLVALAMVVGTTTMAGLDREPALIAAAVAVWLFAAVTVAFDLRYRRGTWRLAGESTRDYVELAHRQLVARIQGIRFGWRLLAAEVLFFSAWIPWVASRNPATRGEFLLGSFGFLALFVGMFAVGLVVMRGRAERELGRVGRVREALADPDQAI